MRKIQSGFALIVGLVLLLVLSLLGIAAMQSTGLQERMAGNLRDRNLAFQAAEVAARDGEAWLDAAANAAAAELSADLPARPASWGDAKTDPRTGTVAHLDPQLAADPIYLVGPPQRVRINDELPPRFRWFYPVLGRGTGGTTDAVVIIQTMLEIDRP